jgi:hypothetical protein
MEDTKFHELKADTTSKAKFNSASSSQPKFNSGSSTSNSADETKTNAIVAGGWAYTNKPNVNALADKLTKDGKLRLTVNQRNHRIEQNLCLYCGEPGHQVWGCDTNNPNVNALANMLIIDGKLRLTATQRAHRIEKNLCLFCGDPRHKALECKIGSSTSKSSREPKLHPLVGKVDKDGKLTDNEWDRRMKEKLCLYCGGPGHKVLTCNKLKHTPTGDYSDSKN